LPDVTGKGSEEDLSRGTKKKLGGWGGHRKNLAGGQKPFGGGMAKKPRRGIREETGLI